MISKLMPAKPPTRLSDRPGLLTAPHAFELLIVPPLPPTKPPTQLFEPVPVTVEVAAVVEFVIEPLISLIATNPPRTLLATPLTAPVAEPELITPSLPPTNPPARLPAPTVTLPVACEPVIVVDVLQSGAQSIRSERYWCSQGHRQCCRRRW